MLSLFKKKPKKITKPDWLNSLSAIDRNLFLYVESLMRDPKVEWKAIYDPNSGKQTILIPVEKKLANFKIANSCIYNNDKHDTYLMSIPWWEDYENSILDEWRTDFKLILKRLSDEKRTKEQNIIDGMKLKILSGGKS